MPRALVALGANLGDRAATLARAVELLAADPAIYDLQTSAWHETPPVGGALGQGAFLNGAAAFETTLTPPELVARMQAVEARLGRTRGQRWAARTIDLDLLLYGDRVIHSRSLCVPHPRMAFRRFVLVPAAEVAAEMRHPEIGWTIGQLLAHLDTALHYVALLGPPGSGQATLAARVAGACRARLIADPAAALPAARPGDSPSRPFERQIQFLDRRRAILESTAWASHDALAISDFYFDQSLVYARDELDDTEYAALLSRWQEARRHVVQPGLLVLLDDPRPTSETATEDRLSTIKSTEIDSHRESDSLRAQLAELATRPAVGPVLYAGRSNPQLQYEEITAAIAAMYGGRRGR